MYSQMIFSKTSDFLHFAIQNYLKKEKEKEKEHGQAFDYNRLSLWIKKKSIQHSSKDNEKMCFILNQ